MGTEAYHTGTARGTRYTDLLMMLIRAFIVISAEKCHREGLLGVAINVADKDE